MAGYLDLCDQGDAVQGGIQKDKATANVNIAACKQYPQSSDSAL